jgi:hypothetical protein
MGRFVIVDAAIAFTALLLWYLWFAHYNRQRALGILKWVQSACADKARITKASWSGSARLLAELRFPPHMFEHARVTVRLLPRAIPIKWALSRWRKEKETLAFEADLDSAPRFQLEVHNHRWSGQNNKSAGDKNWVVTRPGPVVLTSRTRWEQELSPVIAALLASRERNFKTVRFSPQSPHLSATLDIDTLPDQQAATEWLEALRELAAGASTSRQ